MYLSASFFFSFVCTYWKDYLTSCLFLLEIPFWLIQTFWTESFLRFLSKTYISGEGQMDEINDFSRSLDDVLPVPFPPPYPGITTCCFTQLTFFFTSTLAQETQNFIGHALFYDSPYFHLIWWSRNFKKILFSISGATKESGLSYNGLPIYAFSNCGC